MGKAKKSEIIQFRLNGEVARIDAAGGERFIDLLRGRLDLTGTKEGCGKGECGACTILLDGEPVCSCLLLASQVIGREVYTIEGMGGDRLSRVVLDSFEETGAVQCGFCSPGMILSAVALLKKEKRPSRDEMQRALAGNLCRCTGYKKIFDAVDLASRRLVSPKSKI